MSLVGLAVGAGLCVDGGHRFDDIQRHIGISPAVLSRILNALAAAGLLERRSYREPGRRTRREYWVTGAGDELFPVLAALKAWGDRHLADPAGPATVHRHRGCGAPSTVALVCDHGHVLSGSGDITVEPGPGAIRVREKATAQPCRLRDRPLVGDKRGEGQPPGGDCCRWQPL